VQKRIRIAAGAAAVVVIAAVAGVVLYPPANRAVVDTLSGDRLRETRQDIPDPTSSDHWAADGTGSRGISVWDPIKAERGFTLYTSGERAVARLITMNGSIAHEWSVAYSKLWKPEATAIEEPQPDSLVFMRQARLLPNGDLVAVLEAAGHVPAGYGVVKLDKESKPLWSYLQRAHAAVDVAPDGRVFTLVQAIREDDEPPTALTTPFLEDFLVVLSPDGKEASRLSLVEALERSPFASLLGVVPDQRRDDPLGVTDLEYLPDGKVLLSFGAIGVVAEVDPAAGKVTRAVKGPWTHLRAAVPSGDELLVVDAPVEDHARAQRVKPETGEVTWRYTGKDDPTPFTGSGRAGVQHLANGNALLTEAETGRLFEVDADGTVVWEYTNPTRAGEAADRIPIVASGERIPAEALDPAFRGFRRP